MRVTSATAVGQTSMWQRPLPCPIVCPSLPAAVQFVTGGKKFVRAMTLNLQQQQHGGGEVTEDSALEFGAKELEGFKVHLNVVLKVRECQRVPLWLSVQQQRRPDTQSTPCLGIFHLSLVSVASCVQGDPKNTLPAFCEKEAIDLLVIGSRTGGLGTRIRKTLGGGSVSSHLIDSTPCPCLVRTWRALALHASACAVSLPPPSAPSAHPTCASDA